MNQINNNSKENLMIHQKYLELIFYTDDLIRKFPKHERFVLSQDTRKTTYEGLRYIIFAQKEFNKTNKLKYLNEFDVCLNILKVHIRIAYRYKYININNYETWSLKVTEICNLLGGWINSCLKK